MAPLGPLVYDTPAQLGCFVTRRFRKEESERRKEERKEAAGGDLPETEHRASVGSCCLEAIAGALLSSSREVGTDTCPHKATREPADGCDLRTDWKPGVLAHIFIPAPGRQGFMAAGLL